MENSHLLDNHSLPNSLPTQHTYSTSPRSNPPRISIQTMKASPNVEGRRKSLPITPRSQLDAGSEKIGRWSDEEHQVFLRGLERHGKQWKTIATMIGTRTVVQVRTHAQKYFQKRDRNEKPPPDLESTQGSHSPMSKRKSLPTSLPSRKKPRSPRKSRASISLGSGNSSPTPELPIHPSFASTSSMASESWSTVSPSGVADVVDFSPFDSILEPKDEALFDLQDLGEDPLEWLVDGESPGIVHQYLPESSLPFFPDLGSQGHGLNPSIEGNHTSHMIDDAVMNNMGDPNVTVQSLFLQDPEA